jgi:3-hydroxybutyryl-CoA dehydrogenase
VCPNSMKLLMTSIDMITTTAVVGSGYMGGGITQMRALHGFKVALGETDGQTAERARSSS